jgi:CheY-like chemotaxis protein
MSGHQVAVADSGLAGLEAARTLDPDVVLCDLSLPGLDGYTVARALRQDPATAQACLIALSGYDQDTDQRRSREAGFSRHLTKPVDPELLRQVLADLAVSREPGVEGQGPGPSPHGPGPPAARALLPVRGRHDVMPLPQREDGQHLAGEPDPPLHPSMDS